MKKQESYWTYKHPPTPEFKDLPEGCFGGDEKGWLSLSPGYRREIYNSFMKKPMYEIENFVIKGN